METNSSSAHVCRAYSDIFPDPSNHPSTAFLFGIAYSFVFVLGLAGNIVLVVTTLRHRSLQSVQNIFIVNLGISDVILCLLSIPLTPITHINKQWFFGLFLCRIVGAIQGIGVFIGTFSLCAIAIDRYFRVVIAPGHPLRKRHAIRITLLLWTVSILATLPYVFHMRMRTYKGICGKFCTERWPNVHSKRVYTVFVLLIQFALPFTIITICYHAIFSFLRRGAHSRLTSIAQQANLLYVLASTAGGDSHQQREQLEHLIEQKKTVLAQRRRVTVILASMVVLFGTTSLPHNIINLLTELDDDNWKLLTFGEDDYTYLVSLMTHFTAMTSCVSNPVLYAFLNTEFREIVLGGVKWSPLPFLARRSFAATQTSHL